MSADPNTIVERAAAYLREKGYAARRVDEPGRRRAPWTVVHPQGFTFHHDAKSVVQAAVEAGFDPKEDAVG